MTMKLSKFSIFPFAALWTVLWLVPAGVGSGAAAAALESGGTARVSGIVDGDTLVLESPVLGADQVRLVGIQAPKLPLGRAGFRKWPLADDAKSALEALVLGRIVELRFGGRRLDRYGRLLAHLYLLGENGDGETWVQGRLLEDGMARVYSFSDNRALIADMLKTEAAGRANRRGIWGNGAYAIRSVAETLGLIGSFQLVEGTVLDAATVKGRTYLNFGSDWRSDFTISMDAAAGRLFIDAGIDPLALKGKMVRVRGWLKKYNGPMIEVSHPEQIEALN